MLGERVCVRGGGRRARWPGGAEHRVLNVPNGVLPGAKAWDAMVPLRHGGGGVFPVTKSTIERMKFVETEGAGCWPSPGHLGVLAFSPPDHQGTQSSGRNGRCRRSNSLRSDLPCLVSTGTLICSGKEAPLPYFLPAPRLPRRLLPSLRDTFSEVRTVQPNCNHEIHGSGRDATTFICLKSSCPLCPTRLRRGETGQSLAGKEPKPHEGVAPRRTNNNPSASILRWRPLCYAIGISRFPLFVLRRVKESASIDRQIEKICGLFTSFLGSLVISSSFAYTAPPTTSAPGTFLQSPDQPTSQQVVRGPIFSILKQYAKSKGHHA